jgi:phosphopantothenoylcysteine decarboxylase/phosphopantothenate--cysteine ligase
MATGSRVLVAVGGGIAAFKVAGLVSQLAQAGHEVRVAMTHAATQFVGPATFAALSGRPVATEIFQPDRSPLGAHIELALDLDLLVVAPATANLLSKFASGAADCLISTLYLQVDCPVLIAPAMSSPMWSKAAVQRNVVQLAEDGIHFIGPATGWLSCRQQGEGRMSEPQAIQAEIERLLAS